LVRRGPLSRTFFETTGESSSQILFSVADMMGWKFYDSAEGWRSALAEHESNQAAVAGSLLRSTH
jgi:hypothetical protein